MNMWIFSAIPNEIFAKMEGKSFRQDCILPREDLRYLQVVHWNLRGEEQLGELVVNRHIAQDVLYVFRELYQVKYPIEKIRLIDEYDADDNASMRDNNSSSFNFRFIPRTHRISKHGLGMAIDINPLYNPYITTHDGKTMVDPIEGMPYVDRTREFPCKIEHGDICCKIFAKYGFEWGGDWTNSLDYQHFEISTDKIRQIYPNW